MFTICQIRLNIPYFGITRVCFFLCVCDCLTVLALHNSSRQELFLNAVCGGWCVCVFQVLNEVVVDRGPSSYLSNVDLFLDGHLITTVQGDGKKFISSPRQHYLILRNMEFQFQIYLLFSFVPLIHSVQLCACVCPIRPHRFHANRKYSIRCCCRGLHDSPQRPRHHDHPYLPSLPLLQTHCGARRRGAQGTGDVVLGVWDLVKLMAELVSMFVCTNNFISWGLSFLSYFNHSS